MIYASIALFALSAVLGLTILLKWLSKQEASQTVIYAHGVFAATALLILVYYSIQHPENFPKASIALFVVAAIGGFYMFIRNLKQKMGPLPLAFLHALLAVSGFVLLLLFAFS